MTLENLNQELHKRDVQSRSISARDDFDPKNASKDAAEKFAQSSQWNVVKENFFVKNAKKIRYGIYTLCVIAFVAFSIGIFAYVQRSLFSEDRVVAGIFGPDNVNSSDLTHFVVSYENTNRSVLKNAELIISYPSGFRPEGNVNSFRNDALSSTIFLGDIPELFSGKVDFSGKFYGAKNSLAYVRVELRYKPKNLETTLRAVAQKSINIRSSSLAVEIEAPLTVASQGEVNYLVQYENTSDVAMSNIRLKAMYPNGFAFFEAEPKSSEGNDVWYIGTVAPGERGSIRIAGHLDGVPEEKKVFSVEFGAFQGDNSFLAYSSSERSTNIVAPPFLIRQTVNGGGSDVVNPGDVLSYTVRYTNNSSIGLREVIVRVEIEGDVLDFSRIRPEGGAYDSKQKLITWKASDAKQLTTLLPGESGEVGFSIPVRGDVLPENSASKNFRIKTMASIESPDVPNPVGSNKVVTTNVLWLNLNSRLILDLATYYRDSSIPNSGPIPPVVGQETTYTVHWSLSNTTNDVSGVVVSADLPTGVKWMGKIFPDSESISYNERTNKIIWNVGNMNVGEGIFSPKREISFQISIRPEMYQVGTSPILIGQTTVAAKDVFTAESLNMVVKEGSTNIYNDTSVDSSMFRVVAK